MHEFYTSVSTSQYSNFTVSSNVCYQYFLSRCWYNFSPIIPVKSFNIIGRQVIDSGGQEHPYSPSRLRC